MTYSNFFPISASLLQEDLWMVAVSRFMKDNDIDISHIRTLHYRLYDRRESIEWLINSDENKNPFGLFVPKEKKISDTARKQLQEFVDFHTNRFNELLMNIKDDYLFFKQMNPDVTILDYSPRLKTWNNNAFCAGDNPIQDASTYEYQGVLESYASYALEAEEKKELRNNKLKYVFLRIWNLTFPIFLSQDKDQNIVALHVRSYYTELNGHTHIYTAMRNGVLECSCGKNFNPSYI